MSKHFIREIEIKNFKCFKDFKAEGFGRVNLIGGKNNVGKTAFMEAIYLISNLQEFYINNEVPEREKLYFEIIKNFIEILQNRYGSDFLISWILDNYSLKNFSNFEIEIPQKYNLLAENNVVYPNRFQIKQHNYWNDGSFKLLHHQENRYFYEIKDKNSPPKIDIFKFISLCNTGQKRIRILLSKIKRINKNELVNSYLKELFDISKIDLTDDEIILFDKNNKAYNLGEYGDGVKNFINIVLTLLYNQNINIFIDEIENGIHYTQLDRLWEIILTISKEQKVQVFATTHSKECIESYARVAKKLEDNEIKYIGLHKLKDGSIVSAIRDLELLEFSIEQEHEVR